MVGKPVPGHIDYAGFELRERPLQQEQQWGKLQEWSTKHGSCVA